MKLSIKQLQKIFTILGWLSLLDLCTEASRHVYSYFSTRFANPNDITTYLFPKPEFFLLSEIKNLFINLGIAFFCFLIAAVFGMIFHKHPIKTVRNERILLITCGSFVMSGVFSLVVWFQSLFLFLPQIFTDFNPLEWGRWFSIFGLSLSVISSLLWFLCAITIWTLFQHFANLIKFKAEVV